VEMRMRMRETEDIFIIYYEITRICTRKRICSGCDFNWKRALNITLVSGYYHNYNCHIIEMSQFSHYRREIPLLGQSASQGFGRRDGHGGLNWTV